MKNETSVRKIIDSLCMLLCVITLGMIAVMVFYPSAEADRNEYPKDNITQTTVERTYIVVIDAGHGGPDGGAIGSKTGTPEAGLNLEVAYTLKSILEEKNIGVIMTRETDAALGDTKQADMQERKRIMNSDGADIVVSIHMNRFTDPSVKGPMAFYMDGSEDGCRLAECVITKLCEEIGHSVRKANPGDYFVIRESPLPSVLVECGFLSNSEDEQKLLDESYRVTLAQGIAKGVVQYLESTEFKR